MKQKFFRDFLEEGLALVSSCPLCDARQDPMEARILGEDEEMQLLHMRCHKCTNAILALVMVNPLGVSSIGMITDLSYEDVLRFERGAPLTIDHVLQAHAWLETHRWASRLFA